MFRLVCRGPLYGFRVLRSTRRAFFCSASPPRASGESEGPSYQVGMRQKDSAVRRDSRNADYLGQALDVLFLGTGSVSPTRHRSSPSLALRLPEAVWLFDCGENTQIQYQRAKLTSKGLRKVFITHLHGDHIFGLPGLLSHMNVAKGDRFRAKPTESGQSYRAAEENTVEIYGPSGLRSYLRSVELFTGASFCPYIVHELKDVPNFSHKRRTSGALEEFVPVWSENSPASQTLGKNEVRQGDDICANSDGIWEIVQTGECSVKAAALHHTVPTVGYVVQEHDRPGRIDPSLVTPAIDRNWDALVNLGFKNPMIMLSELKKMKRHQSYTFPDGEKVLARDILTEDHPGRKFAFFGDCSDASDSMKAIAMDCDILVHEATNSGINKYERENTINEQCGLSEFIRRRGHSNPAMAGAMAKAVRARALYLNHFSHRYPTFSPWLPPHLKKNYQEFEKSVKAAAAQQCHLTSADVHLAHDLQEVIVPAHSHSPVSTEEKRKKRRARKQLWREERQRAASSRKE